MAGLAGRARRGTRGCAGKAGLGRAGWIGWQAGLRWRGGQGSAELGRAGQGWLRWTGWRVGGAARRAEDAGAAGWQSWLAELAVASTRGRWRVGPLGSARRDCAGSGWVSWGRGLAAIRAAWAEPHRWAMGEQACQRSNDTANGGERRSGSERSGEAERPGQLKGTTRRQSEGDIARRSGDEARRRGDASGTAERRGGKAGRGRRWPANGPWTEHPNGKPGLQELKKKPTGRTSEPIAPSNHAGPGRPRTVGGLGGSAPQHDDEGVGAKAHQRRAPIWKPRSAARSGVRQHYGVNRNIVGRATVVTRLREKFLVSAWWWLRAAP